MKYGIFFLGYGAGLLARSFLLSGVGLLLLWPGVSFGCVGAAFLGLGPRLFGKRPDGTLAAWAILLLLPYFLLTWMSWHLHRLLSQEACCNQVAPGLWLGRRAFARELPAEISLVVDLTAEFAAVPRVASGRSYVCLPTLDASVPQEEALRQLVARIAAWREGVYVHCALGHSRSAMVVVAVLLARGLAGTVGEAEALVKKARPAVRLTRAQRSLLDTLAKELPAMP